MRARQPYSRWRRSGDVNCPCYDVQLRQFSEFRGMRVKLSKIGVTPETKPKFVGKWKSRAPTFVLKLARIYRRIFYSAIGTLANLFLGPLHAADPFSSEELPLGRVAVLGRGRSCELFVGESQKQAFSAVIICNFEDRELASPELRKAISEAPYVILLTQLGEPAPSFKLAKSLGVNSVMIARRDRDPLRKRIVWRLNRLGLPVEPLPDRLSVQLMSRSKGTGLIGVALGSLLSNTVDVFGIEFYRTDYVSGGFEEIAGETGEATSLPLQSHLYQQSLERIASYQESTQFILHCHEDHAITVDNVTISRVPVEE